MDKKPKQILICLGMSLFSILMTLDNWHTAIKENEYHVQSSVFFPMFIVAFPILMFLPASYLGRPQNMKHVMVISAVLLLTLPLGLLNYHLISHYHPSSSVSPDFWPELARTWRLAPDVITNLFRH